MKLNKRIYLLTPLLVLVCVIAAGVFMKAPAKVEAAPYLIDKGSYEAVKLADVIDNEESGHYDETLGDKYQIKEFDTILFDYDGFEYNSVFAYNMGEFFAFKEGNVTSSSQYKKPDGNTRTITNYNTDINAGGYPAKHGIVNSKLSNGNLVFYNGISGLWAGGQVGRLLFDESIDQLSDIFSQNLWGTYEGHTDTAKFDKIRKDYPAKFEFVYDTTNGYYVYNSTLNHAQYNGDNGKIELYADTLGMTNGTKEQMSLIKAKNFKKGTGGSNTGANYTGTYVDYDKDSGFWTIQYEPESVTRFMLRTGENGTTFRPTLKVLNFNIPTNTQSGINNVGTIETDNLEYIYIKFKIFSSVPNTTFNNTLQVILTEADGWINGATITGNKYEEEHDVDFPKGKCIKYKYDYVASQNGKEIELKIPVGDLTFDIGMISICPLVSTDSTFNDTYFKQYNDVLQKEEGWGVPVYSNGSLTTDTNGNLNADCIYFDLYEFGLGYNITGKDSITNSDIYGISSFLPFHKIQDSYEGELEGRKENLDEYLASWSSGVASSYSLKMANRACTNDYYEGGLDAVGNNSHGGTASHFGMKMDIEFFMPNDRKTDFNEDVIFEFSGDDDLWVFVDGYLVLDIGGNHTDEYGKIDFSKGIVTYGNAPVAGLELKSPSSSVDIYSANLTNILGSSYFKTNSGNGKTSDYYYKGLTVSEITVDIDANGNIIRNGKGTPAETKNVSLTEFFTVGAHDVKVFYLERASGMSNCFIKFNLPQTPEGALEISTDVKVADDSDIKPIPEDFNYEKDGYDDLYTDGDMSDDLVLSTDDNGNLVCKNAKGEVVDKNNLITYSYVAKFSIPKDYDFGETGQLFDRTYYLARTDSKDINVSGLPLEIIEHTQDSGTRMNTYIVRFEIPIGYTAVVVIPEDGEILMVRQLDPKINETRVDKNFYYTSVSTVPDIISIKDGEVFSQTDDNTYVGSISMGEKTVTKDDVEIIVNSKVSIAFTNYYKAELYELEIEKTFLDGKPVPVGQSILYTVECGLHSEGVTCDNPLCGNPLYISMLIKKTKDADGNPLPENPNKVIVRDLPKGNYKITEKADWSWRYECYNVEVQRNDAEQYGDGTVISAATSTPAP